MRSCPDSVAPVGRLVGFVVMVAAGLACEGTAPYGDASVDGSDGGDATDAAALPDAPVPPPTRVPPVLDGAMEPG
ncbi:MAG TPA: hypothetical protein VGG33_17905, partial [Polyangia bacterium]